MKEVTQPAIKVFYSYSHEDISLRDELEKHLGILKRRGYITSWNDRDISAGKEWKQEIDTNLETSDIILLLVSPDFIHSDYSYGVEMKRALEKHEAGEARAIPIILRPVDWEEAPFSNLLALPTDAKPITTWPIRDEAFLDVAKGIRIVVKECLIEKYLNIADELYEDDQYEKALAACDHAIRLDATAGEAYQKKMEILTYLERYEEALVACQRTLDIVPNYADIYLDKGIILLGLNRQEQALAAYQQAIDLDPLESDRYSAKGDALFRLERYEEALVAYQRAIDLVLPTGKWLYSEDKGNTLFQLGRYEEAIACYDIAIELIPVGDHVADCLKRKGDALFKLGRFEGALNAYNEGVETLKDYFGVNEESDLLNAEPDLPNEISTFKKREGDTLFQLGRYEEALAAYQKAIDLASDTAENYESKGETLCQLERYQDALVAYDRVISLAPNNSSVYYNKAEIYKRLSNQAYDRAMKIERKNN